MTPTPDYVFDSFALLAYFQDEPAADRVEELLESARAGRARIAISAVNLGEVYYRIPHDPRSRPGAR